jgi:hypothetical protein
LDPRQDYKLCHPSRKGQPRVTAGEWDGSAPSGVQVAEVLVFQGAGYRADKGRDVGPELGDRAWARGQTVWIAEVKSVSSQNEERQLRTDIG